MRALLLLLAVASPALAQPVEVIAEGPDGRDAYPRALAARPLTLPRRLVEISAGYGGEFQRGHYGSDLSRILPTIRWSITDRLELRNLGVYYSPLRRVVELGGGIGLQSITYSTAAGGIFEILLPVDVRVHLGRRAALHAGFAYQLGAATRQKVTNALLTRGTLELDVARTVSLFATVFYRWESAPDSQGARVTREFLDAGIGFFVAPVKWFELRLGIGPAFRRANRGSFAAGGQWSSAVAFRW